MADTALTTRQRLLAAAAELFTAEGYHTATTPVIASRAGVAEGTIYRHFPSKEALFNAAYRDAHAWGEETIRAALETPGRTPERIARLAAAWVAAAESEPARMRLLLAWRLPGVLDEGSRESTRQFRAQLERLIALGKQEGTIRAGGVELWTVVWLALVSAAVERVASREWSVRHPHVQATIDAAWEAIAARHASTTES